jgi:hypothetical protein
MALANGLWELDKPCALLNEKSSGAVSHEARRVAHAANRESREATSEAASRQWRELGVGANQVVAGEPLSLE